VFLSQNARDANVLLDFLEINCVFMLPSLKTQAALMDLKCVFAEESPEKPLPTFKPHDLSIALGDRARFYCEAFVGTLDLPDAKSHIKWYQMFEDQEQPVEGEQEIVTR
jgi:hypothetical protein